MKSPFDLADWKLEDDLREAQRLVRLVQLQCDDPFASDDASGAAASPNGNANQTRQPISPTNQGEASLLGWLLFGSGLSGVVCGCALLVWSLYTGRGDLWNIGLPVALVSQAVLACGLVLQYDGRRKTIALNEGERATAFAPPTQLHASVGHGLHAAGLSVHFSTTPQAQAAPTAQQISQQVNAALRRRAA